MADPKVELMQRWTLLSQFQKDTLEHCGVIVERFGTGFLLGSPAGVKVPEAIALYRVRFEHLANHLPRGYSQTLRGSHFVA